MIFKVEAEVHGEHLLEEVMATDLEEVQDHQILMQ
jgi:hypothetical protein